jgi:hypothetical protein
MVNRWPRLDRRISRRLTRRPTRWWRSINDQSRRWMDEVT